MIPRTWSLAEEELIWSEHQLLAHMTFSHWGHLGRISSHVMPLPNVTYFGSVPGPIPMSSGWGRYEIIDGNIFGRLCRPQNRVAKVCRLTFVRCFQTVATRSTVVFICRGFYNDYAPCTSHFLNAHDGGGENLWHPSGTMRKKMLCFSENVVVWCSYCNIKNNEQE